MPSVHICPQNTNDPIPSFIERGIANQMPGSVHDVPMLVECVYMYRTLAYVDRLSRIEKKTLTFSHFWATIVHSMLNFRYTAAVTKAFNAFIMVPLVAILFEVPVVSLRFASLEDTERASLKALGFMEDIANKNIYVGTPSPSSLRQIAQIGPIGDRIRPGHISYEAYFAWSFLLKGYNIISEAAAACFTPTTNYNLQIDTSKDPIKTGEKSKRLIQTDGTLDTMEYTNSNRLTVFPEPTVCYMLSPSKSLKDTCIGIYADVKSSPTFNMNSIFFPYFHGMITSDKTTPVHVFEHYMIPLLHTDPAKQLQFFRDVRRGIHQLAFHRTGIVFSHIYRGLMIVLSNPTLFKMTIITNGPIYCGFVLESHNEWKVHLNGTTVTSGDVSTDILAINRLEAQADSIVKLLNSLLGSDGRTPVYAFTRKDFSTSRSTLSAINTVNKGYDQGGIYKKAIDIISEMKFGDQFGVPTFTMVQTAISFVLTGNRGLLLQYPAYLGSTVLQDQSRVHEAFSIFGAKIPTCTTYVVKDPVMIVIPNVGAQDLNLVPNADGIKPLRYLPFFMETYGVGVQIWNRLFDSGVIALPPARKGKKEWINTTSVKFQHGTDPGFSSLYEDIKAVVNGRRALGAAGKRKRDNDDGTAEDAGKKKSKKDTQAQAMDL